MIKEHLVSASVTNGAECICNPEVLLGTKHGLWDFENELAPRGVLLDLNAAWELFLSKKGFSNVGFKTIEHQLHEVIDGIVYEEGDTTYILIDSEGNPTGATFTVKANKGPVEHIEWENGKLILYYRKLRPLEDKDLLNNIPIYYVKDDEGNIIIDSESGKPLIYDYVMIPVIEIFDNDETHSLFPWFADENNTVRLRTSIEDDLNGHLGRMAITSNSEVFIAKEPTLYSNVDLVSIQSIQEQLIKDLGFEQLLTPVSDHVSEDGVDHNFRATGSNLESKLHLGIGDKSSLVSAINEDLIRTRINTRLLADKIVESNLDWQNLLVFADSIKNLAFRNSTVPNILAAINWIQTAEIGPFKEEINPDIKVDEETVANITEALNVIFEEAEANRDRIGYDRINKLWIELNTDEKDDLTSAINEVDQHTDALAEIVQVKEEWDSVHKKTYYSNPDLNDITKNRLRFALILKDNVTIVEAINELQSEIGNLSSSKSGDNSIELSTDNKNSVVEAINEVDLHADNNFNVIGAEYLVDAVGKKTGQITNLETNDKSSIVNAINELDARVGELDDLDTDNKDNIVSSINEVIKESPFVYEDTENTESGVVLKNQTNDSSLDNHSGRYSLALGKTNDITDFSISNGSSNTSQGNYTIISGNSNNSKKKFNLVSGQSNNNDGNFNFVNGKSNTVQGNNNIVSGSNNNVITENSEILGDNIYAKNTENVTAIGESLNFKDEVKDSVVIGKNSKINGDKALSIGFSNLVSKESVTIGSGNETEGPGNFAIGENNYIGCDDSYTFGKENRTEGDHTYVQGETNVVKGDHNYVIGENQNVEGDNNVVIGSNGNIKTDNSIVIGKLNNPLSNTTNIGGKIQILTHNTESELQKLISVDLNDWCKSNNSASLNGEKFLDTQHVVNALKIYLSRGYSDNAILRFTMLSNENGFILVQGVSKRIYLNGTWYYSDNIENGWSRHEGEYLKVIPKIVIDPVTGNQVTKHYLALMDQLSTEAIVDTVGGQRSNTEDFGTINLSHSYGAVDLDDIETALDLKNKFNSKVDKYAKIITKYLDTNGVITEKIQNFIDPNNNEISSNITLSLLDSFGFNKFDYQLLSEKGKPNGYAPLESDGLISSDYLPSYVDDVIDVWATYEIDEPSKNLTNIHLYLIIDSPSGAQRGEPIVSGEKGKIYVEAQPKLDGVMSYQFRWTGTKFIAIGAHLVLGEVEGTAFDGGRGKALEDAFDDHLKSGTTTIPVIDLNTGLLKLDDLGNPMWVIYKPNPHHVTAEQLNVVVNDPNDERNVTLEDEYTVEYNVANAIKTLFNRINVSEDLTGSLASILGTPEDLANLDNLDEIEGNDSPTLIGTVLANKQKLDSIETLNSADVSSIVDDYFNLNDD